jgi:hypothetical protein
MTAPKDNDKTEDSNAVRVESTTLFAFIGELEQLKQQAEQRGHDLMLSQAHRDVNNAGAAAYAFCQVRLRAIISQANKEITGA